MDISNFYLGTPMERPEYMRRSLNIIPQEIMDHYNLNKISTDSWVYQNMVRGMYGIPIAGKIANNLLTKRIDKAGCYPCQFTVGLWKHVWRPVTFTLVVDDFGVKFVGKRHIQHLENTLKRWYDLMVGWTGKTYGGIALKWDYTKMNPGHKRPGLRQKQATRIPTSNPIQTTARASKSSANKLRIKSTEPNTRR